MANRREFLQGSVAASMLALSPGLLAAIDTLNALDSPTIYKVLFDPRHVESRLFASAFAAQGFACLGLPNGNVTSFWRDELATTWAQMPAPLAGMTDANALFCLEQLGRQFGLRVLHREQQSGLVAWVIGPRVYGKSANTSVRP